MSRDVTAANTPASSAAGGRTYLWAGVLVVGIVLVLLAQFFLDGLADGNDSWHWMQHAALFWGGVMTGAGALRLYQVGGRPA